MISKEELEIICSVKLVTSPVHQFTYIDYITEDDIEESIKRKVKNRNLAIDAIVDGKIEDYNKREKVESWNEITSGMLARPISTQTVSLVTRIINTTQHQFTNYNEIYNRIINIIDQNTNSPYVISKATPIGNLTYTNTSTNASESMDTFSRKVMSRIVTSGSCIAVNGRIGPATSVIVGIESAKYLYHILGTTGESPKEINGKKYYTINGVTIIVDPAISPSKVISTRVDTNGGNSGGISIFIDDANGKYYLAQTPNLFSKCFAWFEVF
jgi:hypothetical protein